MSKYSDKKKKQLELSQQGVDVYTMYHPDVHVESKYHEPEVSEYVDDVPEQQFNAELIKEHVKCFAEGHQVFYVTHDVESGKRVFRVRGNDPKDVSDKIKPLHLTNAQIKTPENYKFTVPQNMLPPEVFGMSDDKFQEILSKELYKQYNVGLEEYAIWYNAKNGSCRFGRIRADNDDDVYGKFKTFGINPCKIYKQVHKTIGG